MEFLLYAYLVPVGTFIAVICLGAIFAKPRSHLAGALEVTTSRAPDQTK